MISTNQSLTRPPDSRHLTYRSGSIILLLLVSALILSILACQSEPEPRGAAGSEVTVDSVASADGVMVHYGDYGEGERALVLVPCWSCDRSYWDPVVERLRNDYHLVAVDLAGHGDSGREREVWSMPAYGADVAAVVRKLGLTDVILVGHSMGGTVIIEAARLLPGVVTALIGIDTYQALGTNFTEQQAEGFVARFRPDFKAATDSFVRWMFPPGADSALVADVAADMSSAPPELAIASIKAYLTHDVKSTLKDLEVPIRAINSDHFPTNVALARELVASFELETMSGYGHFLYLESPDEFVVKLKKVVAEFWPVPQQQ